MALPGSHSNSEYKNNEEPLSRFWACFFSVSIFALFWTQKMQKTRKWITIIVIGYVFGFYLLLIPFYLDELFNYSMMIGSERREYIEISSMWEMVFYLSSFMLPIILPISLMYKWTTKYNLKTFGYKSKTEWKKELFRDRI